MYDICTNKINIYTESLHVAVVVASHRLLKSITTIQTDESSLLHLASEILLPMLSRKILGI